VNGEGPDESGIGAFLRPREVVPAVLLDTSEALELVKAEIGQEDGVLHPVTNLERVNLGRALSEKLETVRPIRPETEDPGHLRTGRGLSGTGCRVEAGQCRGETDDGEVLDEGAGEASELIGQAGPGSGRQAGRGEGHTEAEEPYQFLRQTLVEPVVAEDRLVLDTGVVGMLEARKVRSISGPVSKTKARRKATG
jgi:hypothetical protein